MATYLTAAYKDRERVKALGARWDPEVRRWFVPDGRDLAMFSTWLPPQTSDLQVSAVAVEVTSTSVTRFEEQESLPAEVIRGIPLSTLLAGIADAVSAVFRAGVWTIVEVSRVDIRGNGHVYLELAERDGNGDAVAQARAVIWSRTARTVIPTFERATGAVLASGIKLLVRARPNLHAVYGLSLEIDAIDPDYTLGDLEAKKREIRRRLQAEGLFERNRMLPSPWDYNAVLVVAPQGAAGLGDFCAESERLERHGVCCFTYVYSRFQGEGAPELIRNALDQALKAWSASGKPQPDALCIIRGGGAVNDLAWLNDYELARWICVSEVPVIVGIGHERDGTILDEVANLCFDTPSKAIGGIENTIRKRVDEAREAFETVAAASRQAIATARRDVEQVWRSALDRSRLEMTEARERAQQRLNAVHVGVLRASAEAKAAANTRYEAIRQGAAQALQRAKQDVPEALEQVRGRAREVLGLARVNARAHRDAVLERAASATRRAKDLVTQEYASVTNEAARSLDDARTGSEALVREITGQGPEKALKRGFVIVRDGAAAVTSAAQARAIASAQIEVEFHDGRVPVIRKGPTDE
jgi:exodeoxyribonuclease VII large subunit